MVKAAIALLADGYKIKVLYCPLSPWADTFDEQLFRAHPQIEWIKVGYHPLRQKSLYRYARLRQIFYRSLYRFSGDRNDTAIRSLVLFNQELVKHVKKHAADLYIGHNLGALPAVVKAAKWHQAKAAFDFEDFHRGEDAEGSLHWKKAKQTEEKYIPGLDFATAASPLIAKAYQALFPTLPVITVNNCFPAAYAGTEQNELPGMPLKLFWFSQFIGLNRGLETVIGAMGKMEKGAVVLSLLGNCTAIMKNYFQTVAKENGLAEAQLNFLPAVEEKDIIKIAASHHIGLACEVPHIINRDICLTNKIFMYILAGNAVLCTNTKAQSRFMQEHPETGFVYEQHDTGQLASLLKKYSSEPLLLQQHRVAAKKLGMEKLNWENEQFILLQKVKAVFESK